jgi:hypothetical protein
MDQILPRDQDTPSSPGHLARHLRRLGAMGRWRSPGHLHSAAVSGAAGPPVVRLQSPSGPNLRGAEMCGHEPFHGGAEAFWPWSRLSVLWDW